MTQADITKAAEDLHGRIAEKENLNIKINEQMQSRERLRQRETALTNQINLIMEQDNPEQKKAQETIVEATTSSSFNQTKIRTKTDAFFDRQKIDPLTKQ